MIDPEQIENKLQHIQRQIDEIKACSMPGNEALVDTEVTFQKQRFQWLADYSAQPERLLEQRLSELQQQIPPELWEKRKSPILSLLNEKTKKMISEVAIIEFLLGEYEGGNQ